VALFAGLLVTIPCFADEPPLAHGKGFSLYTGYQFGGGFTDQTSGQSVRLREGGSFGASLDLPLDESSEFQIFYNHQSTEFTPWPYPNSSDQLRLDYLHIGGTYFPDELGRGVYVAGGIGATRLTPDTAGFDPATRISINVGSATCCRFRRMWDCDSKRAASPLASAATRRYFAPGAAWPI
jgi:hypothetical protein